MFVRKIMTFYIQFDGLFADDRIIILVSNSICDSGQSLFDMVTCIFTIGFRNVHRIMKMYAVCNCLCMKYVNNVNALK